MAHKELRKQYLADGDDCTLRELRDSVSEIKPNWGC